MGDFLLRFPFCLPDRPIEKPSDLNWTKLNTAEVKE